MKSAAIGFRVHSGWAAAVAISDPAGSPVVLDRQRLVIVDEGAPGAKQPYHFAQRLELDPAEKYIANCARVSECLALAAVGAIIRRLRAREYRVVGAAILLAAGRSLPSLSKILASHPLIHTAEGEFFRKAVWKACEHLGISVTGFRERDIEQCAKTVFGGAVIRMRERIAGLGESLGPPWTSDQKMAAFAASVVLAGNAGPADRRKASGKSGTKRS
jgi:hypothetical protein